MQPTNRRSLIGSAITGAAVLGVAAIARPAPVGATATLEVVSSGVPEDAFATLESVDSPGTRFVMRSLEHENGTEHGQWIIAGNNGQLGWLDYDEARVTHLALDGEIVEVVDGQIGLIPFQLVSES